MTDLVQYNNFGDFKVRKYKREVFYNNLWNTDPLLLESRGHVLDLNDNLVARPFKKIFNYKENDTVIDLEQEVVVVKKVNGFMFHVTQHEDFIIEGTTGSLSSPFTELAKENMKKHGVNYNGFKTILEEYKEPMTCIFEIKDNEKDPHIIDDESDGVYLLGVRSVATGKLLRQDILDKIAVTLNVKRPKWTVIYFRQALKEVGKVKHEGFVIYDWSTHEALLKLKSPYYISKKSLMRKHAANVYNKNYKTLVDEEYYPIIEKIRELKTVDEWSVMKEQERGTYFNLIYKSSILSLDSMVKYISNHPKLSYNLKDDVIKINYDYHADYFVSTIDLFNLIKPELELRRIRSGEFRGVGDSVNLAITNLYISVIDELGDYEYLEDFSMHQRSQIKYYDDIKKFTELETENLYQDIRYYSE